MAQSDRALHVAVDARCLNTTRVRSIGRSLYQLISRTAGTGAIHWHLLADRPDRPISVPRGEHIDVEVFEALGARLHRWEQWALPAAARRLNVDVLHAPSTTMPWWQPVPSVVAINEVGRWRRDDRSDSSFYRDRLLPAAYHRASAVMTVSNTSRRDILARWPALKPKLHVVSPGVDERYLEAVPDGGPIEVGGRIVDQPYLLYVGGSDPCKRLAWALQTWLGVGRSVLVGRVRQANACGVRRRPSTEPGFAPSRNSSTSDVLSPTNEFVNECLTS